MEKMSYFSEEAMGCIQRGVQQLMSGVPIDGDKQFEATLSFPQGWRSLILPNTDKLVVRNTRLGIVVKSYAPFLEGVGRDTFALLQSLSCLDLHTPVLSPISHAPNGFVLPYGIPARHPANIHQLMTREQVGKFEETIRQAGFSPSLFVETVTIDRQQYMVDVTVDDSDTMLQYLHGRTS